MEILERKTLVSCLVLVLIWLYLLSYYQPSLLLSPTTTTGGDMGSHYVLAHYMYNYLLPQGKLVGWYPHWLAGLPLFQYYFIPPYLLMSLLGFLIPLEVSFKLVTALGVFLLPLTAYLCLKYMKFKFPVPELGAAFTLPFLFLETYSRWGGNIPSTLAGQVPYGIGLSLMVLSMGLLWKGMETKKYLVANSILIALVILNHIYTMIMLFFIALFLVALTLYERRYERTKYLIKAGALGFLLSAFWLVPMVAKLAWSSAPKDVFYGFPEISKMFLDQFLPFYLLAAIAIIALRKDRRIQYLSWTFISGTLLYLFIKNVNLLYVRFLPFLYLLPLLIAPIGLGWMMKSLRVKSRVRLLTPVIFLIIIFISVNLSSTYIDGWIEWNYEGLEAKSGWEDVKELYNYLESLPPGRIDVEYSGDYNSHGTPRLFEASPVFTDKGVMEGLTFESSTTFPFFYYMQKTVSAESWWPGFPIHMPVTNLSRGDEVLEVYNVKYYVASSDKIKSEIQEYPEYTLLKEIGEFQVYEVNSQSSYVRPLTKEPVLLVTNDWRNSSFLWFHSDYLDRPVVYVSEVSDYDRAHFSTIIYSNREMFPALEEAGDLEPCVAEATLKEEEVAITTDCIDQPVLVKVSYFPNWRVEGAEKVYLVSPNLMLIFPESEEVRLYYGTVWSDWLGVLLTASGMVYVLFTHRKAKKLLKKF